MGANAMELFGVIGSVAFATCAIPQVVDCYRKRSAEGLSWMFLILWAIGELFTIIYIWPNQDWILLSNYFFNSLCLVIMIYFKIEDTRK
jgi:uncharacterized protein with PQ loop repeat